jgi:mannosyltransferase OCH1-like enzyme
MTSWLSAPNRFNNIINNYNNININNNNKIQNKIVDNIVSTNINNIDLNTFGYTDIIPIIPQIKSTYKDEDITAILHHIDNNTIKVETYTIDNIIPSYQLIINNNTFNIYRQNQNININHRHVIIEQNTKIPKKIIQTWETSELSIGMYYSQIVMKKINPDYEYIFHDANDREQFIKDNYDKEVLDAYNKVIPKSYKADLWKYCCLYKYGGLHFDLKSICKIPFSTFITNETELLLASDIPENCICAGFFGCMPGDSFIKKTIDEVVKRIHNNYYGVNSLDVTSTSVFGSVYLSIRNSNNLVDLIKKEVNNNKIIWWNFINENGTDKIIDALTGKFIFYRYYSTYYKVDNKIDSNHYYNMWLERRCFLNT